MIIINDIKLNYGHCFECSSYYMPEVYRTINNEYFVVNRNNELIQLPTITYSNELFNIKETEYFNVPIFGNVICIDNMTKLVYLSVQLAKPDQTFTGHKLSDGRIIQYFKDKGNNLVVLDQNGNKIAHTVINQTETDQNKYIFENNTTKITLFDDIKKPSIYEDKTA